MITEKKYNPDMHPEDRIFAVKKFINELSNVQDFYFNQLLLDSGLKDEVNDYLFDYIFNEEGELDDFEHYLINLGKTYEEFVDKN